VTLLIDTAAVSARDRVDFWSAAAFEAYLPVQIQTPAKDEFEARMWGYRFGPLSLFRIAAAANTMMRTSRAIAACDPECLHVSIVLRGQINAVQEGRTGLAGVGDVISYETSHPVVFRAVQPFETLVVRVPREMLGRQETKISNLTAVGISGSEGLPRAAVAFVRGLVGGLEDGTITSADAPNAVDCVLDMIRGLYATPAGALKSTRLRSRGEILFNVQAFIEANLGDPDLDPEEIARASFISTRYLHKLFEAEHTTVCRWIREARLERCRRDLLDPALAQETILEIASRWGLPGAQHFSRLFRSEYGCPPSELRRETRFFAAPDASFD
jgi:AraC-like DNA-binding protein